MQEEAVSESREFELQAEIASLRKDAERYRWLRENDGGAEVIVYWNVGHDWISSENLDASIDAAMCARHG